ncbi:MAG: hypothetical protein HY521_08655 [Proteobacteria bacterium]|nr:hypothetical protein [Pseudomonadota bacterium]
MRAIKHRVGLLIPSTNTLIEPEYADAMPRSVSVHVARLTLTAIDEAGIRSQDRDIARQARALGTARVEVILFCQTSASYFMGRAYDAEITRRIEEASGRPAITAAKAINDALAALGARRVALASPYAAKVNEVSARYLIDSGFEVVGAESLGLVDSYAVALVGKDQVLGVARRADRPGAEAVVIPGGNMPCLAFVAEMEAEFGKPVVCTNGAGLWALIRHLGGYRPLPGYGRLLAERLAA